VAAGLALIALQASCAALEKSRAGGRNSPGGGGGGGGSGKGVSGSRGVSKDPSRAGAGEAKGLIGKDATPSYMGV
jgi:hypothetical protein